jgi:hypothetical protein
MMRTINEFRCEFRRSRAVPLAGGLRATRMVIAKYVRAARDCLVRHPCVSCMQAQSACMF